MVMHPVLESKFRAAVELIGRLDFVRSRAARDPRDRGDLRVQSSGATATGCRSSRSSRSRRATRRWCRAPCLSERTGCEVWLKFEGANPTGSFKDRGMTVAVSAAIDEGAEAVICASTGNTAASAAAYAARAGLRGAVIVPEGKIATGKLAQALMHGARVIALRGNFDQALALVRELTDRHPIALVNSVNEYRIEGQKTAAFEVCDQLGEAPDVLCIPVGNAGNVTSWWRGFSEYERGAGAARLPGRGRGAAGARRAGREPGDRGVGDPDRQPRPLGGGDERLHRARAAQVRAVTDDADPRRLRAARLARGRVLRAGLGGVGGRPAQVRRRGPRGVRAHRPRPQGPADRDGPRRAR